MTNTVVPAGLLDRVRSTLALTGAEPTPAHVAAALRADGTICGDAMVLAVVTALRREALGAGPLDSLLAEPGVTDILVNGPDEVYIDRGRGLEFVAIRTGDEPAIRRLATRLAAAAGRRLDDSTPYVDVRLSDGTRFHAVLAPIAAPGTCLSLRVPSRKVFTLDDLVSAGALPQAGAAILQDLLESRLAFLISGGTGTGKTTPGLRHPLHRASGSPVRVRHARLSTKITRLSFHSCGRAFSQVSAHFRRRRARNSQAPPQIRPQIRGSRTQARPGFPQGPVDCGLQQRERRSTLRDAANRYAAVIGAAHVASAT